MVSPKRCALGAAGLLLASSAMFLQAAPPDSGFAPGAGPGPDPTPQPELTLADFLAAHPGVTVSERAGRVTRLYGNVFSTGDTPEQSVGAFLDRVKVIGPETGDVVPTGPAEAGHQMGLMYDAESDSYKFTVFFYAQERDGVPVYKSAMRLLVRNEPGFPLVLASAEMHDLGDFRVDAAQLLQPADTAPAVERALLNTRLAGAPEIISTRKVIFAGYDENLVTPRLANETVVGIDIDRWQIVTDAETGAVLDEEQLIYMVDIDGHVQGLATEGVGSDVCEFEVATPLPYLEVSAGGNSAFSDINGDFTIPNPGAQPITVTSDLNGQFFDVNDFGGLPSSVSVEVTPPGPANLTHNPSNSMEFVRAQVNAYLYSNLIRDFVLEYVPNFGQNTGNPIADETNFTVNTNRTDGFCPGNAWYSSGDPSINFCQAEGTSPNTAWSSVIIHEYGHHLVNVGGSGQCEYGEGMSDVMSVLYLDDPNIGVGFFGSCSGALRDADNTCQYDPASCSSCGGPCHTCGQLISGCIWSTRNNLVVTEPDDYRAILTTLALSSIPLHTGQSITPEITIDYLTLDDDDADLSNGTPHFDEIGNGFADHGMFEISLDFSFPGGLPQFVTPGGGTTVMVDVAANTAAPQPNTGQLLVDSGGGFQSIPMNELAPNSYEAVFPPTPCGESVNYYFAVGTTSGGTITEPSDAPVSTFNTISGTSFVMQFADDAETDPGYSVSGSVTDGEWERGMPISNAVCDRGNPGADGDGSGQCWLTDNSSANNCNSDVDNGTTILTSPVLDASGETFVSYWRWFDNTAGSNPNTDTMTVQISNDGGSSWAHMETIGPVAQASGGWFQSQYRISDIITPTDQFRIRFSAIDADPGSVVEAGFDGLQLFTVDCGEEPIPGDLDGDGDVDTVDFLALLAEWGPCPEPCPPSCAADLDGNCDVDTVDFLELLANFTG